MSLSSKIRAGSQNRMSRLPDMPCSSALPTEARSGHRLPPQTSERPGPMAPQTNSGPLLGVPTDLLGVSPP